MYIVCWGFPGGAVVKNPPANAEGMALIPGSGNSPGVGNDKPLQYSCVENPMDRGARWATVHRVTRVGHALVTKPPPPYSIGNATQYSAVAYTGKELKKKK